MTKEKGERTIKYTMLRSTLSENLSAMSLRKLCNLFPTCKVENPEKTIKCSSQASLPKFVHSLRDIYICGKLELFQFFRSICCKKTKMSKNLDDFSSQSILCKNKTQISTNLFSRKISREVTLLG